LFSQSTDSLLTSDSTKTSDSLNAVTVDSMEVPDSLKRSVTAKRDTVIPIQGEPLGDVSTIINKRTFLFTNYRYTGDLLRSFSFNFIKDLGFIGQPHETFIYGVGNNGISFLQDGILLNSRFTNSFDLNLLQSEDIDSIEIVPSTRGFLYGPNNNPVTVNFITRDFIPSETYSRIRYYEGPEGEAMIDGKFNSQIMKRWNLSFQATNRSVDETYTNTEFGIWQANAKLKYFLSNSVNISGSYYFVSANQGLNGGVDFDSLSRTSNDPNADLYDPVIAPVLYPNRTLDVTQHNFSLRTLAKPFDGSKLDLSFYYRYNLDEYRDFQDSTDTKEDTKNKSLGAIMNYLFSHEILSMQLFADYEHFNREEVYESSYSSDIYSGNSDRLSYGAVITLNLFDNFIKPSAFYKQNNYLDGNYTRNGLGMDVLILPSQNQSLYIGYSLRESIFSDEFNMPAFEIGIRFETSDLLTDMKYFNNKYYVNNYTTLEHVTGPSTQEIRGLGLILNYKIWLILLETNTSYIFEVDDKQPKLLPNLQFVGGLYLNNLFFEGNLNLKAGFKFYYTGTIDTYNIYWLASTKVEPTNKLDFTLAGEIKGAAIFYFIWENLIGKQYYITPYYPMPERNIRFGLAWELFN
jgi:outer membrane cobalamin receptor